MKKVFAIVFFYVFVIATKAQKTLIFEDDFKNNDAKWSVTSTLNVATSINKGKYIYEKKTDGNNFSWNNLPITISATEKCRIETKVSVASCKANGFYTIMWDVKDANNFYGFSVYPQGGFEYIRRVNGQYISLKKNLQPPGLKKAAETDYTISIEINNRFTTIFVNGRWISGGQYEGSLTKSIGYLMSNEIKVEVDYLRIYQDPPVIIDTKTDRKDLYPAIRDINDKIFSTAGAGNYLYVGCVDGNCQDGDGTFIAVSYAGYGSGPEYVFTRLDYRIVKGTFSDNGTRCTGTSFYKNIKVAKKNKNSSWKAEENIRYDKAEKEIGVQYEGEMIFAEPSNDRTVKIYYPHGNGEYVQREGSAWESCKALYFYGWPLYASIRYRNAYPFASFDGYVSNSFTPVLGTAVYKNGDIYEGSFIDFKRYGNGKLIVTGKEQKGFWENEKLLEKADVFVPDSALLRKVYSSQQWNKELQLRYNPFYYFNAAAKATVKGRFIGADGKDKDASYTGNGIFIDNSDNLYFGSFLNGKPHGLGFYNGGSTQMVFGMFQDGMFVGGAEAYEENGHCQLKQIIIYPGNDELLDGWGLFQTGKKQDAIVQYEKAVAVGNYEAMYQLGLLLYKGDGIVKDLSRAEKLFVQSAATKKYDMIRRIANMYETDRQPANLTAEWFKRSAEATSNNYLYKECAGKYFRIKYPYLSEKEDIANLSFSNEATIPSEEKYKQILAIRKADVAAWVQLNNRPKVETKYIEYTETSVSIGTPSGNFIYGKNTRGDELQLGDFVWTGRAFSEVHRGFDQKLSCAVKIDDNLYYRVIREIIPVPYIYQPPACYRCGGTGGTQGGTLTGGGLVSGHVTTVTPTIVGGVSQVTTTTTYGPPMSIYIPPTVCKVCKGKRREPYDATQITYRGKAAR